ncbi:RNA polymerase sigma factor SigJ [Desertimonas flava]|uniref:RNA polymerase sigma factor SigJ n=1 Tax=Desertimonas flava TaxID=2064846 RepID=UPI0019698CE8|nr:RNA polymerase sigma factor SigJ [Desertimonas flava]
MTPTEPDEDRRVLINVAYRMLGSLADAEDAVQDAYVRWYRLTPDQRASVESVTAWLVQVTSRICLDVLRSAPRRREHYLGEWLPEPVPARPRWRSDHGAGTGADPADPADRVTLDESVSTALLVVLETLTPAERVAFVLHDVFRHTFVEIAAIVGRSPAACRQLATAARRRIAGSAVARTETSVDAAIVAALKEAWDKADLDGLAALLDPDVVAVTDGGGLVSAPIEAIHGAVDVARLLVDVPRRQPGPIVRPATVNGTSGIEASDGHRTLAVISIAAANGRITHLWIVRNPTKLAAWNATRAR